MAESTFITGRKVVRYLQAVAENRSEAQLTRGPNPAAHRRKAISARNRAFKILDTIPGGLGTVNTIQAELSKKGQAKSTAGKRARTLLAKLQTELRMAQAGAAPVKRRKAMGRGSGL